MLREQALQLSRPANVDAPAFEQAQRGFHSRRARPVVGDDDHGPRSRILRHVTDTAPAATKRRTSLMGIANARPPAIIVLIPTTRPVVSARGPPELPGASRRSAWIQRLPIRVCGKPCTTPAVSVRRRPRGWPTATPSAPTRSASESVEAAGVISTGGTRSSARSARRSDAIRLASTCRSLANPTRTRGARATCAFVTMRSGAHRTPAPPPPGPETSTVISRSRSAIHARWTGASAASGPLTDRHLNLPGFATSRDTHGDGLAHSIRLQHGDEISGLGDRLPGDGHYDVADDEPRRGGRAFGGDVHDDHRRALGQAEPLAEVVRQHDGLRADTEIGSRDPAAADHVIGQSGDRGSTNRALQMPGGAGRRDADHAAEHVDERPAGEAWIEREIDREHRAGLALTAAAHAERAHDAGAGAGAGAARQNQMADAKL